MKWICKVCGYIYEGAEPPEICPVCKVGKEQFEPYSNELSWPDSHQLGIARGIDQDSLKALRALYTELSESVGTYLAMARAAQREGLPSVALMQKDIAQEKARHASLIAELLGEVASKDTKNNIELRVASEHSLAHKLKERSEFAHANGNDSIHDVIHEICKDSSRIGMAQEGLYKHLSKK
ncbi:MAG: NADH peroxidase [Eubacteriales bacterium]|nr:NADH peroxidase [Eubacteriales bacterium]